MNSGKVSAIIGGNAITTNYDKYSKVHVNNINIDINGGSVNQVSALSPAVLNRMNTALGANYYSNIENFYYADKVNIDIANATINTRVFICSSYTYAKEAIINIDKSTITSGNEYGVFAGTNGKIGSFTVNINDSKIGSIHSGLRAMVNTMNVNVSGNSTIGDIYAGSYYALVEQCAGDGWKTDGKPWSIGSVDYGQVGNMTFNLGDKAQYNNIYAGFQYLEKDKFNEVYAGDPNKNTIAAGIANSETAKLIINVASAPKITNSGLQSMMNINKNFVSVNFKKEAEIEVINPNDKVDVPTIGIVDKNNVQVILNAILTTNTQILEYIKSGIDVEVKVESKNINKPSNESEFINKIKALTKNARVVNYFDISINILDASDDSTLSKITEINGKMNLSVILPDNLKEVSEGYKRNYYILREHNGTIEILNTQVSTDGKYIAFSSDKFSTFALAYSDTPKTVTNPNTFDKGIMNNLVIISGGLLMAVASALLLKKNLKQKS